MHAQRQVEYKVIISKCRNAKFPKGDADKKQSLSNDRRNIQRNINGKIEKQSKF